MLDTLKIDKQFDEDRAINGVHFKLNPRDMYIMNQYTEKLHIENRTTWLTALIEADIKEKIESGFVEIH